MTYPNHPDRLIDFADRDVEFTQELKDYLRLCLNLGGKLEVVKFTETETFCYRVTLSYRYELGSTFFLEVKSARYDLDSAIADACQKMKSFVAKESFKNE